jgi:cytochrome c55X
MAKGMVLGFFLAALTMTSALAASLLPQARQAELIHLLKHDCGSCHGMTLKGGLGPALRAPDLEGKPAALLADVILDGVPGTPMPPWRGALTPAEAVWLAEALKNGASQ